MVIGAIYRDNPRRRISQIPGGRETVKATTDDHYYRHTLTYRFRGLMTPAVVWVFSTDGNPDLKRSRGQKRHRIVYSFPPRTVLSKTNTQI
jgi:hypothetical protein